MASFDANKYKNIFDQRHGKGSFDTGLSSAREIGQLQAQADFAKQSYNERIKQAEKAASKKTFNDALNFWNQPENKSILKDQGAVRNAENIKNDPILKEEIKAQGFNLSDYIDAMYAASSDGKFRSEREYNQFSKSLKPKKDSGSSAEDILAKYGSSSSTPPPAVKSESKKSGSFLDDILSPLKRFGQAINPFDDVSFSDAFKLNVQDATSTERSPITQEATRGLTRIANTATLGSLDQIYKKTNDGQRAAQFTSGDSRNIAGKVADFGYDTLGYLVPGMGAYKAVRGVGAGLRTGAQGSTKVRQLAQEGALTGAMLAGGEIGIREAINPQDTNYRDNLLHLGIGTAAGAIADPALYGIARMVRGARGGETSPETITPSQELLPSPNRQEILALPEPQRLLPEPNPMRNQMERAGINFAQNTRNIPSSRMDLSPVEAPIDPLRRDQTYWQGRYEDFARHVNGNYDMNNMTPESLEDLWSSFARYDEPVKLEQVVDLAYPRGIDATPTVQTPRQIEQPPSTSEDVLKPLQFKRTVEVPQQNRNIVPPPRVGRDFEPIQASSASEPSIVRGTPIDRTPVDIQNPKEVVKKQINTDGKRPTQKFSFEKAYTAMIDDLHPLEKAAKDLGGKDIPFEKNPYKQARLARGVSGKAETYIQNGIYNNSGQKVGKSLKEIVKPIESKLDDFLAYSASKRALDYDTKGLTAGIKPRDIEGFNDYQLAEATIRQIDAESPDIKAVHEELVKYNNRLMDDLVEAGVLSRESVETLRAENPNYIPMFRVQDPKIRGFEPLTNPKRTYANLGEPVKKRTGSQREIINPIESIIKNTYLTLNMAERNKAGRLLLDLAEESQDNVWARVISKEKGLSIDDIGRSLDEANAQLNDGNSNAVDDLFKGQGNKVYVYKDGQRVEMELQEDLYKAMLSLDAQKQNFFIKLLAVPTRTLRTGAVLSPDFGPVNIFRDQLSARLNSKHGFVPFVDWAKGMKSVLKQDDYYNSWKHNGGANSVLSTLDREYLQKDIRKLVKQSMGQRIKSNFGTPKDALNSILEPLRKVSEITEESTRVGEFKKALKKGKSPQEAAFESRDLIDFSRAGTHGRQYNQITAFFNAAVQSMDKLARSFKENPIKFSVNALSTISVPTIAMYYANKDKEWYKEIPQREKDLFWHFEANGQIFKLPKPFEAGIMFGTSWERFLDYLETNDPEAFEGFGKTVRDAFTPSWIPTALAPWIEVFANKSTYFQSPIVPRREENLLPEDQYGAYQSELSKIAGKAINQSPRKVEQVFKGYTGGLGKYFLSGTDKAFELMGSERPELPDKGLAGAPIVNRFVAKDLDANNQSIDEFYKKMDSIRRERASAKKNDQEYEREDLYKTFNSLNKEISELQKLKREIIEHPSLDGKRKADEIKKVDRVITQIAQQVNGVSVK